MDKLFAGWDFVFIYLDDILIASKTFSEHITHLKKVLQRLQEAGLGVKPSKCAIAEHKVEYLGFVLSSVLQRKILMPSNIFLDHPQ